MAASVHHSRKRRFTWRHLVRMLPGTDDCVLIVALLLAIATAVLTAPYSAAAACHKLQSLLLLQSTPEWIAAMGAVGQHFPVSP